MSCTSRFFGEKSLLRSKPLNVKRPNVLGRFIQPPIAQTVPERQRLGPSFHILDKRLPVLETQPNLALQTENGNSFSFGRQLYLHRKRHMTYNASLEESWEQRIRTCNGKYEAAPKP